MPRSVKSPDLRTCPIARRCPFMLLILAFKAPTFDPQRASTGSVAIRRRGGGGALRGSQRG